MTAAIARLSGPEAYDLIYPDHLSTLPPVEQEIMQRTMVNSMRIWVGYDDDKILCYMGLIPPTLLSDRAYLWLCTTEHLSDHVFLFVRHSQRLLQTILNEFPLIVGHVQVGSDKSIRWLRWLGAKFGNPDGKLIPFEIRAE